MRRHRAVLDELVNANNRKVKDALPANFYDLGVRQELRNSGFVRQITGQ